MRIFCDFDGTISTQDTTDLVLSHLADPAWEAIEDDWIAGRVDAATCMRLQIAEVRGSLGAIEAVLDRVSLRPGFTDFVGWARRRGTPLAIVSDGVEQFIRHVLTRHGLDDVPVFANRLLPAGPGRWTLHQPWRVGGCTGGSGVCKCNILSAFDDRPLVFVGDGRSDFCVANQPDILFATASLEHFCRSQDIAHQPFADFDDVRAALERISAPAAPIPTFA